MDLEVGGISVSGATTSSVPCTEVNGYSTLRLPIPTLQAPSQNACFHCV